MIKNYIGKAMLVAALIPAIFTAFMINRYGVNVPFGDDWVMPKLFYASDHSMLGIADFWHLHNEHRVFFPKILMFAVANITHWNLGIQIVINFLFVVAIALILALYIHRKIINKFLGSSIILIMSAWLFSPVQSENWIWAWQFSWYLCLISIVMSFFILNKIISIEKSPFLFAVAVVLAIIASFSLGGGLLVWFVGLGLLFVKGCGRKAYLIWSTLGVISSVLYYSGYTKPSTSPPTLYFFQHKIESLRYLLTLFGRPITDNQQASIILGSLILATILPIAILLWKRRSKLSSRTYPIIALLAYCIGVLIITTISRVGFGVEQATASRYTFTSEIFLVALIILIGFIADSYRNSRANKSMIDTVVISILAINIPLLIFSYANGIVGLKQRSLYMHMVKNCTHETIVVKDCANIAFPGFSDKVTSNVQYIKNKGWGGY